MNVIALWRSRIASFEASAARWRALGFHDHAEELEQAAREMHVELAKAK